MRLLPWVVPATSFLVAAVQAQSAAAIPTDLTTPSGVNVANVPDCAVGMLVFRRLEQTDETTESMLEQLDTIRYRLCADRCQMSLQQSLIRERTFLLSCNELWCSRSTKYAPSTGDNRDIR